jgi:hypothetical protein
VLWSLEGRLRDEVDAVSTNEQVKDQIGRHLVSNQPGPLDYLDELRDALAQEPLASATQSGTRGSPSRRCRVSTAAADQLALCGSTAITTSALPSICRPSSSLGFGRRLGGQTDVRQSRPLLSHSSLTGLRRPQAIAEPASRRQVVSGRTTANPWSQPAAPRPANRRTGEDVGCTRVAKREGPGGGPVR